MPEMTLCSLTVGVFSLVSGKCVARGMLLSAFLLQSLHDFGLQFFAQFGIVFEQCLGGIPALS